ncbi:hypothetical protein ACJRO7_001993 [Eucalyptus globulus]|uniref:Pectinesterase inhibitor domain-containing protein n=1 Tax=Eucalyptus globulus TaxID=34317 RepID=A0ABD3LTV7_EUCGL
MDRYAEPSTRNGIQAEETMTSFNYTRLFTAFCLLLFSLHPSRRPSAFVEADATTSFIQKLCSQTLELDACQNCVSSAPTQNIPRLTYLVLFCMYTGAVYTHEHADQLSQTAMSPGVKQALKVCRSTLFTASNNLSEASSR